MPYRQVAVVYPTPAQVCAPCIEVCASHRACACVRRVEGAWCSLESRHRCCSNLHSAADKFFNRNSLLAVASTKESCSSANRS